MHATISQSMTRKGGKKGPSPASITASQWVFPSLSNCFSSQVPLTHLGSLKLVNPDAASSSLVAEAAATEPLAASALGCSSATEMATADPPLSPEAAEKMTEYGLLGPRVKGVLWVCQCEEQCARDAGAENNAMEMDILWVSSFSAMARINRTNI